MGVRGGLPKSGEEGGVAERNCVAKTGRMYTRLNREWAGKKSLLSCTECSCQTGRSIMDVSDACGLGVGCSWCQAKVVLSSEKKTPPKLSNEILKNASCLFYLVVEHPSDALSVSQGQIGPAMCKYVYLKGRIGPAIVKYISKDRSAHQCVQCISKDRSAQQCVNMSISRDGSAQQL